MNKPQDLGCFELASLGESVYAMCVRRKERRIRARFRNLAFQIDISGFDKRKSVNLI